MLRNPRYAIAVHDDELYATVTARGAALIKPLRDEPWHLREFGIRTVDGHRIMFGRRLES